MPVGPDARQEELDPAHRHDLLLVPPALGVAVRGAWRFALAHGKAVAQRCGERILDIDPVKDDTTGKGVHQRVPVFLGSKDDVAMRSDRYAVVASSRGFPKKQPGSATMQSS